MERQTLGCGAVREQRDKSLRGEVQGIFLQFKFRFRNGEGRTIALQSLRITQLIIAKFLQNFARRKTKIK